jgi:hypothetical protein
LRRNGGQAGGEIEFIVARLPTLQIWLEKITKIPEKTPQFLAAKWKKPTLSIRSIALMNYWRGILIVSIR